MQDAFICDAVRTPIGRYGGALASVRADDLAAIPLKALMERNAGIDWAQVQAAAIPLVDTRHRLVNGAQPRPEQATEWTVTPASSPRSAW